MDINRKTAMETLTAIENNKAYSHIALNSFIAANNPDNPAQVREMVYGVLKNKLYVDYILSQLIATPPSKLKNNARTILRMGIYQMIFMQSVPDYAAVNESVNLAKKFARGQSGFINGVLRGYIRGRSEMASPDRETSLVRFLSVQYSYSEWIIALWLSCYDADFVEALLAAGNETPRLTLRVNRLKATPESLLLKLAEEGFEAETSPIEPNAIYVKGSNLLKSALFLSGSFSVQDESSMLAVDLLDPKPGELIIDLCAAPGGKTLYIAEKMQNHGRVLAWDFYDHKLALLNQAALRNGLTIIETSQRDSRIVDTHLAGLADRVLVDAPCSGLGVVRRKPEIKYVPDSGQIGQLAEQQLTLLETASTYLKPEGVLIYSTCTISSLENEQVVKKFLSRNTAFDCVEQKQLFPHIHHTDGFFMAKLIKKK